MSNTKPTNKASTKPTNKESTPSKFEYCALIRNCICSCDCEADFDEDCDCGYVDCDTFEDATHSDVLKCQTNPSLYVCSVEFKLGLTDKYTKTLKFDTPVSEATAVLAVEEYLSVPLTRKYYLHICDDLDLDCSFSNLCDEDINIRGDLLNDTILDRIESIASHIKLITTQ